jgi:hypothetical protein
MTAILFNSFYKALARVFTISEVIARRMDFARRSRPLKRQEIDSASRNAGFAMI